MFAIDLFSLRISTYLGPVLRLPGSLLSDDPIDNQFFTADPHTDFQRATYMRSATQRGSNNLSRAVQAVAVALRRSHPKEDVEAGDAVIVWREIHAPLLAEVLGRASVRKATDAEC